MSGMSCSIMRIVAPVAFWMLRSRGPSASVSFCEMPDAGSSSRSSFGSSAIMHASSSRRSVPYESSDAYLSA